MFQKEVAVENPVQRKNIHEAIGSWLSFPRPLAESVRTDFFSVILHQRTNKKQRTVENECRLRGEGRRTNGVVYSVCRHGTWRMMNRPGTPGLRKA